MHTLLLYGIFKVDMAKDKIKHTITVDPDLIKEIKLYAVKNDNTYGEIVEKALEEFLEKHRK